MVVWKGYALAVTAWVGVCLSFALTPLMATVLTSVNARTSVPILVGVVLSGVALLATYIRPASTC
jgi:hypothetical protein